MFDDVTIALKTNCQMHWARMVHCDTALSMRDCNFYGIVTESVLNGIGFGLIKNLLGSLISHVTYFVK